MTPFKLVILVATSLLALASSATFKAPEIKIDGWSAVDDFQNWNTSTPPSLGEGSTDSVLIVPNSIGGLSLLCNSTRPIEWSFHREKWGRRTSFQTMITTSRESDLSTPRLDPLWYTAEVRFVGGSTEITGNYTCQLYGQPEISRSVYVYWEGSSPPYLTLLQSGNAKRTIKFNSKRFNAFTLPCTVSRPDIIVDLFKIVDKNTTITLSQNESIKFDPAVGYTLTNLPDPLGDYQCSVGFTDDHDSIDFEVISGDDDAKPEFDNKIWGNASFSYDASKKQFHCCSSSSKPPRLAQYFCNHPISCKLRKHVLHNMETPRRRKVEGSCSILNVRLMLGGGVLRCVGDNIDIVREYFFPVLKPYEWTTAKAVEPFFTWSEADPDKMMSLTNKTTPFYIGQTISMTCQVSSFFFSQGIQWGIKYKNETTIYVKINQTRIGKHHPFGLYRQGNRASITITAEEGLSSINCHAPGPTKPTVEGEAIEERNWNLNETDKVLTCRFFGIPLPRVSWKKGNKTLFSGIVTANGTSTLKVPRVGLESHGTYSCNISNAGGIAVKVFNVYVSAPVSTEVVVLYIFAAVCMIGACVGAFIGLKKLKEQKDKIRQLANVAFKEVTDGPSHQGPALNNQAPAVLPINGNAGNGFFSDNRADLFANNDSSNESPASDFGKYQKM